MTITEGQLILSFLLETLLPDSVLDILHRHTLTHFVHTHSIYTLLGMTHACTLFPVHTLLGYQNHICITLILYTHFIYTQLILYYTATYTYLICTHFVYTPLILYSSIQLHTPILYVHMYFVYTHPIHTYIDKTEACTLFRVHTWLGNQRHTWYIGCIIEHFLL